MPHAHPHIALCTSMLEGIGNNWNQMFLLLSLLLFYFFSSVKCNMITLFTENKVISSCSLYKYILEMLMHLWWRCAWYALAIKFTRIKIFVLNFKKIKCQMYIGSQFPLSGHLCIALYLFIISRELVLQEWKVCSIFVENYSNL